MKRPPFVPFLLAAAGCATPGGPIGDAPPENIRPHLWSVPDPLPAPDEPRVYECRHVSEPPVVDGILNDTAWRDAASRPQRLVDAVTGEAARLETNFMAVWDERALYIGIVAWEPDIWGTMTERNSPLFLENNLEIFLDPGADGVDYVELEFNALNTLWDLFIEAPPPEGGVSHSDWTLEGLEHAVRIWGTLNWGADTDKAWTLEVAIPWTGIAPALKKAAAPPRHGDEWRLNVNRIEWRRVRQGDIFIRDPQQKPSWQQEPGGLHEENWAWSPPGKINFHIPSTWGTLRFLHAGVRP